SHHGHRGEEHIEDQRGHEGQNRMRLVAPRWASARSGRAEAEDETMTGHWSAVSRRHTTTIDLLVEGIPIEGSPTAAVPGSIPRRNQPLLVPIPASDNSSGTPLAVPSSILRAGRFSNPAIPPSPAEALLNGSESPRERDT